MKDLSGAADATVAAPVDRCLHLVGDLEGYGRWYGSVIREARGLERDAHGTAHRVRVRVRVPNLTVLGELEMTMALIARDATTVTLARVAHGGTDHERFEIRWRAGPADGGSRLEVALDATLSVPRLVPTGGLGMLLARGFVGAAADALGR